jgi:hypothetical protein
VPKWLSTVTFDITRVTHRRLRTLRDRPGFLGQLNFTRICCCHDLLSFTLPERLTTSICSKSRLGLVRRRTNCQHDSRTEILFKCVFPLLSHSPGGKFNRIGQMAEQNDLLSRAVLASVGMINE